MSNGCLWNSALVSSAIVSTLASDVACHSLQSACVSSGYAATRGKGQSHCCTKSIISGLDCGSECDGRKDCVSRDGWAGINSGSVTRSKSQLHSSAQWQLENSQQHSNVVRFECLFVVISSGCDLELEMEPLIGTKLWCGVQHHMQPYLVVCFAVLLDVDVW